MDGETRPALAITRSLGSKGHRIVVGAKAQSSLAQASRYCSESFTYPDPVSNGAGFVEVVVQVARDQRVDVVLPVTAITTALVVENRAESERYSRVPFPMVETFNYQGTAIQGIGDPL